MEGNWEQSLVVEYTDTRLLIGVVRNMGALFCAGSYLFVLLTTCCLDCDFGGF